MKKGIEAWGDWERDGEWVLRIAKKRGKLTLEDILETAKEYDADIYFLVIDAAAEFGDPTGWEDDKFHVPNDDGTVSDYDDMKTLHVLCRWKRKDGNEF